MVRRKNDIRTRSRQNGSAILYRTSFNALAIGTRYASIARLAWLDVIKTATWILVVLKIELEETNEQAL
jgi:hypothetical protein